MDEVVIIVRLRKHVTEQAAEIVADEIEQHLGVDVESARVGRGRMNGRTLQADAEQG